MVSASASFNKRVDAGEFVGSAALASVVSDLLSLVTDLAGSTYEAHVEHYEWGAEVDQDLEDLKDGAGGSALLPEDSARLKTLLLACSNNLRAPADATDEVLAILKAQISEALNFLEEIEIEDEEIEDEDKETQTPKN